MQLGELNVPHLREAVKGIKPNQKFDTTKKVAASENQLRVTTFEGTILGALNTTGAYGAFTIGQLAIKTGIPATMLHSVIYKEDGVPEDAETAIDRLSDTILSLSLQKAEAA